MTQQGLYGKYHVYRVEDRGRGDRAHETPVKEFCFVLKPDSDPLARDALKIYAALAHLSGYEKLAEDLINVIWDLEYPEHKEEDEEGNSIIRGTITGRLSFEGENSKMQGSLDTRPRIYEVCGNCKLRIWQHAGDTGWHHENIVQATIVGGGGHPARPESEDVVIPGPGEEDGRPPIAPGVYDGS